MGKSELTNKVCLDAGCGNGRYTYATLRLGAARVDSIDISTEGVAKCKEINPNARVKSIFDLAPNPIYDFVLCWGILNHVENRREGFSKVASQIKQGGILHVMVYHRDTQKQFEQGRRLWSGMSLEERLRYCREMAKKKGGTVHGWFDAFNPKYNCSFTEDQIINWFEEEGFAQIRLIQKYNINMNGRKI